MSTEVELKYLILNNNLSEDVSRKITAALTSQHLSFNQQTKKLTNCYFDTPDLALRKLDFGLRVRTVDGVNEQTIKTAGKVVGGLHQRPEFNINIEQTFPNLGLFPSHIWPKAEQASDIQQQLISLFNTDFTRETWLIKLQQGTVELAFDYGTVSTQGADENIYEIELELVSGDVDALFILAELLFSILELSAGSQSKAARGYRLFASKNREFKTELLLTKSQKGLNNNSLTVDQLFVDGVDHYLNQLQTIVAHYFVSKNYQQLADLVDCLSVLRHGFWLFDNVLDENSQQIRDELSHFIQQLAWVDNAIYLQELMNKTGNYRKKLEYSQQLVSQLKLENRRLPEDELVVQFLHSERFNQLQLKLLQLLVKTDDYLINSTESELATIFAQRKLSENLNTLQDSMQQQKETDVEGYLLQRKVLHRCLLTGNWFGFLFDGHLRQQFRVPWLDMKQGLRELQSLWIIKQQLEKLNDNQDSCVQKIVKWQQSKVDNLLVALNHTKNVAIEQDGYWIN